MCTSVQALVRTAAGRSTMIGSAWVDFVLGAALIALPQHKVCCF